MRLQVGLAVGTAALVFAHTAAAARLGIAEVRGPSGALIAATSGGFFASPADGSVLQVDSATSNANGVHLNGVSILGGRVRAQSIVVPARGLGGARIDGLVVEGQLESAGPNTLIPLGTNSYLVVLQEAMLPAATGRRNVGVVGLRISIGDPSLGVPEGTQLLVGLAGAARPATASTSALAVLGF